VKEPFFPSHLAFRVGERRLAIALDRVREVVPPSAIASLPFSRGPLVGAANVRGIVVPVVDLSRVVSSPYRPGFRTEAFVVVERRAKVVSAVAAFLVDEVSGVACLRDLNPAPHDVPCAEATAVGGSHPIVVLDVDEVLRAAGLETPLPLRRAG
jgi:chemotaxis signal transduction protein